MAHIFEIKNRGPVVRRPSRGRCIYCGATQYNERTARKLGDEHVIAEGLGGTLVIEQAACEYCERLVDKFEQPILKSVLYAPRVHLGVRRKRRKRGEEFIKVQGVVDGEDVEVSLPVRNIPVLLLMLNLGPPGILVDRPSNIADTQGVWCIHLNSGAPIVPTGFTSFASPMLDTFKFCQFLAKIGHCFALDVLGDEFAPTLLDLIKTDPREARYDLIGGTLGNEPPSNNLHELELDWRNVSGTNYAVVKIRLFASLGTPTYLAVVGTAKQSDKDSQHRATSLPARLS